MLTCYHDESKPCSGGWPNLRSQKYRVNSHPGMEVHVSYYHGSGDVKPLTSVAVVDLTDKANTPYSKAAHAMFDNRVPQLWEVEAFAARILD